VVCSDVARPLSYKTKTTAFFKDHKIINPRPLAQPESLIERGPNWKSFCDVILVTFFGDVMVMTSLLWRRSYILKFDFVIISFKKHYLAKSRNFRSPILKV